jgi:hypothetical protein
MEAGIIKKWDDQQQWGIIYCPGQRRFFIHAKAVVSGTPKLFSRVTFDVGVPRSPVDLPPAINVTVGESVVSGGAR